NKHSLCVTIYAIDTLPVTETDMTLKTSQALISKYHPTIKRSPSKEPTFNYSAGSVQHTVYFQDRSALAAKFQMLLQNHPGIRGIAIWVMGNEDPGFWNQITKQLR